MLVPGLSYNGSSSGFRYAAKNETHYDDMINGITLVLLIIEQSR